MCVMHRWNKKDGIPLPENLTSNDQDVDFWICSHGAIGVSEKEKTDIIEFEWTGKMYAKKGQSQEIEALG